MIRIQTEMTTAEMELDWNTNFDWNRIQESGQELEPLSGPGYTGLINLGNRAKLGHGLLSGKYSVPALEKDEVATSTTPTSSVDALEFFLHLIDKVVRDNSGNFELDPTRSFKFGIEERLQCPSGKVSYSRRVDHILSLNIPLYEAINKEQLAAFHKLKADKSLEGKEVSGDEIVRPRVPLEACLANFSAPVEVDGFYSTALNAKTTAIITTGLTSFPDYLVLHMRRFVAEEGEGWVPKKLDVCIDVPDVIDISHMRSRGLQPGEELLPEAAAAAAGREKVQSRVDKATNWVFSHMEDIATSYDIDTDEGWNDDQTSFVDQSNLDTLISFGFQEELAWSALVESSTSLWDW